ncbi:MAG: immunoglobulin-like domain-containing protein, partial [Thiohalomonadales bacterium]
MFKPKINKSFQQSCIVFLGVFMLVSCADEAADKELDTSSPVITLNGESTVTLIQGTTYVEAGAIATDDVDGDVGITTTGTVDVTTPNTYIITYTATDSTNNSSTATRTVIIVELDTVPPEIILNGASTVTLIQGSAYVEAGASATDNIDGNVNVTITGNVDVNTPESYIITYTASDNANNSNTAT